MLHLPPRHDQTSSRMVRDSEFEWALTSPCVCFFPIPVFIRTSQVLYLKYTHGPRENARLCMFSAGYKSRGSETNGRPVLNHHMSNHCGPCPVDKLLTHLGATGPVNASASKFHWDGSKTGVPTFSIPGSIQSKGNVWMDVSDSMLDHLRLYHRLGPGETWPFIWFMVDDCDLRILMTSSCLSLRRI